MGSKTIKLLLIAAKELRWASQNLEQICRQIADTEGIAPSDGESVDENQLSLFDEDGTPT